MSDHPGPHSFRKFLGLACATHFAIGVPVLAVLAVLNLMPWRAVLLVFAFVLLLACPTVALVGWLIAKGSNWANASTAFKVCGIVPAQLYGFLGGGMIGFRAFGTVGGVIGAIAMSIMGTVAAAKLTGLFTPRLVGTAGAGE